MIRKGHSTTYVIAHTILARSYDMTLNPVKGLHILAETCVSKFMFEFKFIPKLRLTLSADQLFPSNGGSAISDS